MKSAAITVLLLAGVASQSQAGGFLKPQETTVGDAESSFKFFLELQDLVSVKERPAEIEGDLKQMFEVLPKNQEGNLGHQAVRYVLHRFFQHRHGWYIKGLEPGTQQDSLSVMKEWVPTYLQDLMEKRVQTHGIDLRELSVLVAALEDLVRKETAARLEEVYAMMRARVDDDLPKDRVEEVMNIYLMGFLSNWTNNAITPTEALSNFQEFSKIYEDWPTTAAWLKKILAPHLEIAGPNALGITTVQNIASEIGQNFSELNDRECKSLKSTMLTMEGRKKGRVPLPEMYKKSMYSHWNFSEKIDYLRALGALDESEVNQPQVIIPNYLMSRPNCLEATDLYAVCCRNECEDLMSHLEAKIAAPFAKPEKVLTLVSAMSSDTVQAPRKLPENLDRRLQEVATANGGQVPLHGRLFAQWMHHVFPRECPYPHEQGAINPQTPDEWMKETGHESTKATADEMQTLVDACAAWSGEHQNEEDGELPWSTREELLGTPATTPPAVGATFAAIAWIVAAGMSLLAVGRVARKRAAKSSKAGCLAMETSEVALLCVALYFNLFLLAAAYAADLVDTALLALGLVVGCAALTFMRMNQRVQTSTKCADLAL